MKRLLSFGILGLFLVCMMSGVLAISPDQAGTDIKNFLVNVGEGGSGFFSALFGDIAFGDGEFLTSFFFAILLGMIIYSVISSFFDDVEPTIQWIITIAITSISFVAMPGDYLQALRVSYGAMGLSLLTIIPFIIILWFTIKAENLWVARATWAFFSFYYFALLIGRWTGVKALNEKIANAPISAEVLGWGDPVSTAPYWIALFVGIFMFFFIPQIRKLIWKGEMESYVETAEQAIKKHAATQKLRQQSDESVVGTASK